VKLKPEMMEGMWTEGMPLLAGTVGAMSLGQERAWSICKAAGKGGGCRAGSEREAGRREEVSREQPRQVKVKVRGCHSTRGALDEKAQECWGGVCYNVFPRLSSCQGASSRWRIGVEVGDRGSGRDVRGLSYRRLGQGPLLCPHSTSALLLAQDSPSCWELLILHLAQARPETRKEQNCVWFISPQGQAQTLAHCDMSI
jgi:hypothetical protein